MDYSLRKDPQHLHRSSLHLSLMHYHLKSGGVVSVMRDIARSLIHFAPYNPKDINVLAALDSQKNIPGIFEQPIKVTDVPPLAYRARPYQDKAAFVEAANKLALKILDHIDLRKVDADSPHILHAHNISLGKNPTATMAFHLVAQIARERSLPLWLINQVHDFAENNRPYQINAFFNCTGRYDPAFALTFMYPNGSNVMYLTINSADLDNLRTLGIPPDRMFLLPDPVDTEKLKHKPIWEEEEWKGEALPPADYKEVFVKKLAAFALSSSQVFDVALPILLSPMKVMRRKNNLEALLLNVLFQRLGRRFQLLISLDANSPPDIEYSGQLKRLAASMNLPLLVGFGHRLVSGGGMRQIENGKIKLYSLNDTIALSKAVLTTSILEGFGLVYHEGWLCGRPVIGRKIPEIVRDFEQNGLSFDQMYDRLAISFDDIENLKKELLEAYGQQSSLYSVPGFPVLSPKDIIKSKIFVSHGHECIDFSDLDVRMQLRLIARCHEDGNLADRIIERNHVVAGMLQIIEDYPARLIEKNMNAIQMNYSLQTVTRRLEDLFEAGDSLYRKKVEPVIPRPEAHAAVLQKYRDPGRMRLLLGQQTAEQEPDIENGGAYE